MPVFHVQSDILGVNLQLNSDNNLDEKDVFDVLRQHDPELPMKLLKKYERNREDEKVQNLALKALDSEFFKGGSFTEAFSHMAGEMAEGVENLVQSEEQGKRMQLFSRQFAGARPDQYQGDLYEKGVTKAAQYFTGLTETSGLFDSGWADQMSDDLSKSLKFAGLPDDGSMRRQVTDRALGLNKARDSATRGQAAIEAFNMSYIVGRKGEQWAKDIGEVITGNATERGDNLNYLDFLVESQKTAELSEQGAETAALLGGAKGVGMAMFTTDPKIGSSFGQPGPDTETLKELRSGAVEPDMAQAMALSIPMSPDFGLTMGASGALNVVRNSISRGAIRGLSVKASEEVAMNTAVKQLTQEGIKRTPAQNQLLAKAKTRLSEIAGSQEKLNKAVAKNKAVAESLGITALQKEASFSPTTARLMDALNRAPGPQAPLLNRTTAQALKGAGVTVETFGRTLEFLHRLPEESLTTLFMRSGMEEAAATAAAKTATRTGLGLTAAGVATGGFEFDPTLTDIAIATLLAPGGSQLVTRLGRDMAIFGRELAEAQASSPAFQLIAETSPTPASLTNVALDRSSALTLGGTVADLRGAVFSPTRQFGPSPVLQATAGALTRTGFGNTLMSGGRLVGTAARAASFPAAFGYAIGGPEGAGGALGASVFPLVVGMGLGHLGRVKGGAELQQKMAGDVAIFKRDHLSAGEKTIYEGFGKTVQQAIATSQVQNPDVVVRFKKGKDNASWQTVNGESVLTVYEKSSPAQILSAVLGHEIGHHIDAYGFGPHIIEEVLGSVEKEKPGFFTEYENGKPVIVTDKDGNQIYKPNMEFSATHADVKAGRAKRIGHRQQYLDRLEKAGHSKDSPQYQRYANDDSLIAREVFAAHSAEYYFGGQFVKQNYEGAGTKLMKALVRPLFGMNGMRKFFHRIGLATEESTGLVADPTGLMPGLKQIPALTKMIKDYNNEVRGLNREARRAWSANRGNLVDHAFGDETATASFTAKDLENPSIAASLKAGGHVSIRDDGSIETDASGRPVFLPTRTVNKNNKQLANDILEIIQKKEDSGESFGEGHVALETTADGKLRASGRFLDPSIINELGKLNRYNPHQLDALKMINSTLKNGTGEAWNLFYYSALKWNKAGRKVYGQIKGGDRPSLPFGVELTKDGNVVIQTISIDAFSKNLEWFAKSKGWGKKMLEEFGTRDPDGNLVDTNNFVLAQRAMDLLPKYLDNHTNNIKNGSPESGVTPGQRDLINAAIGKVNAEQVAKNPILEGLGDRRSSRQQSIRSRRLDRIGNARRSDALGSVNMNKIIQNLNPRQLAPVAYHGTPHTFKAEEGAPLGKFKTAQIGTGEGAQAYGHGLYFAGKKQVADHYRQALGYDPQKMKVNGRQINKEYDSFTRNPRATELDYQIAEGLEQLMMHESPSDVIRYFKENDYDPKAIRYFEDAKYETFGSLYKVELAPKENEYLLWDKPLSEQPKGVREKIEPLIEKLEIGTTRSQPAREMPFDSNHPKFWKDIEKNGDVLYGDMAIKLKGGKPAVSAALKDMGIPGIKYLDGSSRSKGKGDYNYVIFDESDVAITEKMLLPRMTERELADLRKLVQKNPDGFTVNLQAKWADKGFVVAPEKRTEAFIRPNKFNERSLEDYIYKFEDVFDRDGSHLGGWYDTVTDRFVLDVVFPLSDYRSAIEVALWGDQDAIFSLNSFKEIRTKDKNGRPIIPKGFGESARSIIQRKPDNLSAFAETAWRRSQGIRQEGSEGLLQGPARAGKDAGTEATSPAGRLGSDDRAFIPEGRLPPDAMLMPADQAGAGRGRIESREYPRKTKHLGEGTPYHEYEWVVETLNQDGEIVDVDHFDINNFPGLPDKSHDVALRKVNGLISNEGDDLGGDFSYSYLDEQGNLAPTWDQTNEKVPAKWKKIVSNQIKSATGNRGTFDAGNPDIMLMPVLQDAIKLVEERGRVAEAFEETFFSKMLPKMLRKVGGQVKASARSLREGARRAIEDVMPFMRDNPDFADFYDNDMAITRQAFDDYFGRVSDEEFLFFQVAFGLTSPGTKLRQNTNEGIGATSLFLEKGNLNDVVVDMIKGRPKLKSSPFSIGSTSMSNKARTLKIFDRLIQERGSISEAVAFLEEAVPMKELNQFNREMGYAGGIGKPSDVKRIVKQATGQDELIPRVFIFGPKVGAFTLNSIGRHAYNTIDVWEARFIRSYFRGMFDERTGLPETVDEHLFMTRFTEIFKEELESMTGETFDRSSLQASRWFFIIDTAKRLGYTKASTNDTVSGYAKQQFSELGSPPQGRRSGDSTTRERVQGNPAGEGQPAPQGQQAAPQGPEGLRQFMPQVAGGQGRRAAVAAPPQRSNRFLAPPAVRESTPSETLERFR
ncbi:hypothetical protein OAK38_06095 [Verrucomicrobia bacterium]|nr:hypothetical protein [Verrucomicrobiota bacterium]